MSYYNRGGRQNNNRNNNYSNRRSGQRRKGKIDAKRITGLFSTSNPECFVGSAHGENLDALAALIDDVIESGKSLTFWLYDNGRNAVPQYGLSGSIGDPPNNQRRGGNRRNRDEFEDDDADFEAGEYEEEPEDEPEYEEPEDEPEYEEPEDEPEPRPRRKPARTSAKPTSSKKEKAPGKSAATKGKTQGKKPRAKQADVFE